MSEDEGKPHNAQKKTGKQQKGRAWLKEGEEDDPLNFLDPKVSQRVLGKIVIIAERFFSLNLYLTKPLLFVSHQTTAENDCQGGSRL